MGINGLWDLIKPASTECELSQLSDIHGYSFTKRGDRILVVGVDISVIMDECMAAVCSAGLYEHCEGGPLRTFFYKLCKFLKSPIIPVFVFDGQDRPKFKRGKSINPKVPWWTEPCQSLIESFGFFFHQAPGEAEAELALLNQIGKIDAIITSDSDSFVFGACHVLRSIPKSDGRYTSYRSNIIKNNPDVSLSRGGFLLIALMSGGDYSKGVRDCGGATSLGLAKCGFGDSLFSAFETLNDIDLEEFLSRWICEVIEELRSNSHGFLSSKKPRLALQICSDFLQLDIVNLYRKPIISSIDSLPGDGVWFSREPSIEKIGQFCVQSLGWRTLDVLSQNLINTLWEGVFLRLLVSTASTYNSEMKTFSNEVFCVDAQKIQFKRRARRSEHWARISINTASLLLSLNMGNIQKIENQYLTLKIWLSSSYLPTTSILPHSTKPSNAQALISSGQHIESYNPQATSHALRKRKRATVETINPEVIEISD